MSVDSTRDLNSSLEMAVSAKINARSIRKATTNVSRVNETMFSFSFSKLAKQLKFLQDEIDKIENEDERKKSKGWFEDILSLFSEDEDRNGLMNFVSISRVLVDDGDDGLLSFLGTISNITAKQLPIKSWLNNASRITEKSLHNQYLTETNRILKNNKSDSLSMLDTFGRFTAIICSILAQSVDADIQMLQLRQLFESIEYSNGLQEKDESMTRFAEQNSY